MNTTDEIYETYRDWDMSKAKRGNSNPMIKRLQDAQARHEQNEILTQMLDRDVLELLKQRANNQKDVERINTMLRVLFA